MLSANQARALATGVLGCMTLCGAVAARAVPASITVGRLTLTLCNSVSTGYCGAITRPIDPAGVVAGHITVGFEFYPRTDRSHPRLGTILPQEGGPGYSSTGTRDFYLGLFKPLRNRRDVLIVDKRGTGLSDPVNCPALQSGSLALSAVAECARLLGPTAWYYGTAFAAGDIVAVLDALDIDTVDFYGDSYGTFVGQVLAALDPTRLRSIILDSAYPVRPPDAWFPTDWATAWNGIDLTCSRSPSCSALGGMASGRVRQLLEFVRDTPITGMAPDGNGVLQQTTIDTSELLRLIDYTGTDLTIYRDLDAAARAWLDAGDSLPVLRLAAEFDTGATYDPAAFSYGLYTAVVCSDYPLLYDLRAPRSVRSAQYQDALADAAASRSELFAPFTFDEGIASQAYITPLDSCLPWPASPASQVPGKPLPPGLHFPAVPTLVLSGDLDSVTSPQDAAQVTAQIPNAVHVVVPNLNHVVAGSDHVGCTSSIALKFVETLAVGDTSCIDEVRAVRTVAHFARLSSGVAPVAPLAGNAATDAQRRLASVAVEAAGDVIARYFASSGTTGAGLRGGQFSYTSTANGYRFALDGVLWSEDVAVSGTVDWNTTTDVVAATLTLNQAGSRVGSLRIGWNDADLHAVAAVAGTIQGATLKGRRVAP